jgi:prolyl-tRNA editing enzyme YbaK/EbsC (Cys-tRNA(Pro) deacylase)
MPALVSPMPVPEPSEGVRRVVALLAANGHAHSPVWLDDSAHTAAQAAEALGVELGQIAKSIVFRRLADDAAVLVIASGDRRVDERKVAALVGALGRADAAFVKASTGFTIGGVPPIGHVVAPVTLIDRELFRFDRIWAAAGHPRSVFALSPAELEKLAVGPVCDVAAIPPGSVG